MSKPKTIKLSQPAGTSNDNPNSGTIAAQVFHAVIQKCSTAILAIAVDE